MTHPVKPAIGPGSTRMAAINGFDGAITDLRLAASAAAL
jgi:hypothetical protein